MIFVILLLLAVITLLCLLIYVRSLKRALTDEDSMDFEESSSQVVFLPSHCQREVGLLIDKFTGLESNLDLSELRSLIDQNAGSDRVGEAIRELREFMVLPEPETLRSLTVEQYVVEVEQVMRDYVHVIISASQQGHDAVGKTEELLKQIDSIFTLVDGLRHIADQTGLLALNAAIEAAKTGDVGRSYSYMAKEVQRLSAQSDNFGGDIKAEMLKAKTSVEATTAMVDQIVVSDLRIALETRSGIDQLIGQLQALSVVEALGFSKNEVYSKIISEMHKIVVVVLMKIDLIQRLGLVDGQFKNHLNQLKASLTRLYLSKVLKKS